MDKISVPEKMLAWPLFGAGLDKLGQNGKPCLIDVPVNNADELLVRIDAIGLCFSDVKLIRAGEEHPRVISKDLSKNPVIPGHEAVMTVVKVGKNLENKFNPGERFIIQADIYVDGKGYAYGYAIDGGMAQYSIIDHRVLNGDEGCYLLPLKEQIPSAVAALMEPWTCVQASYMIENRIAPKSSGSVLVAAMPGTTAVYQAGLLLTSAMPAQISAFNLCAEAVSALEKELGKTVYIISDLTPDMKFDDVFLCDISDRTLGETIAKSGNRGAVFSFIGEYPDEVWSLDVGRIHYEGWFYQGTAGNVLSAAYGRNVRSTLKKGGSCWLPGGAGAMGQMHTQMAVESTNGPMRILISDMDDARIENVCSQLADRIKERGIEFKAVNPSKLSPVEFEQLIRDFAPDGFDDIVMLVPVIPVLNNSSKFLKTDGLMNIFAGIPAGKDGELNVRGIANAGIRYIGSSGSRTAHLRQTLELVENNALKPVTALAAVGGMNALKRGLDAVINAEFPGKTVIFPNCPEMPLTPVKDIGKLATDLDSSLSSDGFYTAETEKKLMEIYSA